MEASFQEALKIAQDKYPHQINHFEEYEKYFVFEFDDGIERIGGDLSPIVIRKADGMALNYAPIFFDLGEDAEEVGEVVREGTI